VPAARRTPHLLQHQFKSTQWRESPKPGAYARPFPIPSLAHRNNQKKKIARSSSASSRQHRRASFIPHNAFGWVPSWRRSSMILEVCVCLRPHSTIIPLSRCLVPTHYPSFVRLSLSLFPLSTFTASVAVIAVSLF
jgi:hypothetical protein